MRCLILWFKTVIVKSKEAAHVTPSITKEVWVGEGFTDTISLPSVQNSFAVGMEIKHCPTCPLVCARTLACVCVCVFIFS